MLGGGEENSDSEPSANDVESATRLLPPVHQTKNITSNNQDGRNGHSDCCEYLIIFIGVNDMVGQHLNMTRPFLTRCDHYTGEQQTAGKQVNYFWQNSGCVQGELVIN